MKRSNEARENRFNGGLEIRESPRDSDGPGTLVGYAAIFNSPSNVMRDKKTGKAFREIVQPGSFSRTLRSADVRALYDHDTAKVLGRSKAGTLRLAEDARGLRVEIDLPDNTAGRDTAVSVSRGDVTGMSFGFYTPEKGDSWDRSGAIATRHLHDVDIDEITVTAFPAYSDSTVAIAFRSLERAEADADAAAAGPTAAADPEPAPAVSAAPDDSALMAMLDIAELPV